ncbi:DUF2935 domain-containing protein [Bacillus sp. HMF5848]|uniref:DUF2935 domain-containing protein n=1 Tax=Bacillus sp. HMF5848 TaxID=2495421 RepID=UPI00163A9E9C|nr:DUF2935 domain-containing protein [Bacillus sp. HMF5848]
MNLRTWEFIKQNTYEHAVILYDTLSPMEKEAQAIAQQYIQFFKKWAEAENITDLQQFIRVVESFQQFLLWLLKKQVTTGLKILLTPTFMSHLVTESSVAIQTLTNRLDTLPLSSHFVWLPVLSGDAFTIQGALDSLERPLVTKYLQYADLFEKQYVFAHELNGIMRTGLTEFPALQRFRNDTKQLVGEFIESLNHLEQLEQQNSILDKPPLFFVQHIKREAQYFSTLI